MSLPPAQVPSGTVAGEDINDKIQYIYWGLGGGGGGMDPAGSPTLVVPNISSAQSSVFRFALFQDLSDIMIYSKRMARKRGARQ